jgi:large subunit ribosomal protein L13
MSTYFPRADEVRNDWYVLDAADLVLGRVATRAAMVLMGKHKPDYTPFLKTGDHVVVINAEKVILTGKKEDAKLYRRHSSYPGGLSETTAREMRATHPHEAQEPKVLTLQDKVG